MKKCWLNVVLVIVLIFAVPAVASAYDINVVINSDIVQQSGQRINVYETGHISLKSFCEINGASYSWDESTQTATAIYQAKTFQFTANSKQVIVDNQPLEPLCQTIFVDNGELTVPVQVLYHVFKYGLYYDGLSLLYFLF